MKVCNHCGAQLPDNATVCFRCKATLGAPAAPQQQRQPQQARQNPYAAPGGQQAAPGRGNRPVQPAANAYAKPPVQPTMGPANQMQAGQAQSGAPVPPPVEGGKKKLSTGALIGIIGGAVALVAIIVVVLVIVLGGGKKQEKKSETPSTSQSQEVSSTYSSLPEKLTAEKINTVKENVNMEESGLYYKDDNGKYGLMSFDGKKDTGAIYTDVRDGNQFFVVTTSSTKADENIASSLNIYGLADYTGKELIPQKYGFIKVFDDRFAEVMVAKSITKNKDDCLFYMHKGFVSFQPDENSTMYTGTWQLFDLKKGDLVPGVEGTKATNITISGSFIEYIDDANQKHLVDSNGKEVPDNQTVFSSGEYIVKNGDNATVYDKDGKQLYNYNETTDYVPTGFYDKYCVARKTASNGALYAVLNTSGKVVSKEFADPITVNGELILCEGSVYSLKGDLLVKGDFTTLRQDEIYTSLYYLSSSDKQCIIDEQGKEILSDAGGAKLNDQNLCAYKEGGSAKYFYSLKSQKFDIGANSALEKWLVSKTGDQKDTLIDTISANKLIDGYDSYGVLRDENNTLYVYAQDSQNHAYDIYVVR